MSSLWLKPDTFMFICRWYLPTCPVTYLCLLNCKYLFVDKLTETRRCTTVQNSDYQALLLSWAPTPICICSLSIISIINSISASVASVHRLHASKKISAHIHQVRSYQPISINTPRHAPDTTRHHQTPSDMVQTPPDTTRHASCMVCMV